MAQYDWICPNCEAANVAQNNTQDRYQCKSCEGSCVVGDIDLVEVPDEGV
jgi:transposase-like protein